METRFDRFMERLFAFVDALFLFGGLALFALFVYFVGAVMIRSNQIADEQLAKARITISR